MPKWVRYGWIGIYLGKGKPKKNLRLCSGNVTLLRLQRYVSKSLSPNFTNFAFSKLCDDSFEEHVLPYPEEFTGLHLHGLNRNEGDFRTLCTAEVDGFAEEWGLIKTSSISLPTIPAVREFTDEVSKTGIWNGQAIEGFVVRTKVAPYPTSSKNPPSDASPYPPGHDFFFKVKFDEPYMTYRDWREITKTILSKRGKGLGEVSIPRSKLRRPESHLYRRWVEREIDSNPTLFEKYSAGKGIIAVRDKFLVWLETDEGKSHLQKETDGHGERLKTAATEGDGGRWKKVVIVPVAGMFFSFCSPGQVLIIGICSTRFRQNSHRESTCSFVRV